MIARLHAILCLWVIAAALVFTAPALRAQETGVSDLPSGNDLHEFTRLLADERIQNWIRTQAEDGAGVAREETVTTRQQLEALVARTRARVGDLGQAWAGLARAPDLMQRRWQQEVTSDAQVRGLTFVMIFLFLGAGLEWLFRQYTNPIRLRIEVQQFAHVSQRIRGALLRAFLAIVGLTIFSVGSIGAFASFNWPPLLETLVLNLLFIIIGVRGVATVLLLFLAPKVAELRLLPLGNALARTLWQVLLAVSALFILALSLSDVFARLSTPTAPPAQMPEVLAVSVFLATLVALAAIAGIVVVFRACAAGAGGRLSKSQRLWRMYLISLVGLSFLAWLLDAHALMWSIALLGLLVPGLGLAGKWVDLAFDRAIQEHRAGLEKSGAKGPVATDDSQDADSDTGLEQDQGDPQPYLDPYETYRPIAQRVVRFAAVISVGVVLAMIWKLGIFEASASPSVIRRIFSVLIDSAVAILIADLVWVWAKTAIDRRLAAYKPPEDGVAPGPEARMATLLPLLRMVLMVTLLIMVSLSILSSMGVNIAPILAGAGVLGIAIGFGAQSLVKDIVSGIFFLIDDAFRVGEYVEIDQLRGTVESISIRSLQIRHHRGAVHTLPFGEVKSMTNYSRDWVIMKLEFRVPFDTDLKLVKKIVKQVGATLKANEHYGDSILDTLKSQGVRRMEEFNMVVGVKFMTRPGEQWLVRRDAYQMVRDAFDANGIRMAERNVKVEISGDEHLNDEARTAVSAAAQEAIMQQTPKGAIPDEP